MNQYCADEREYHIQGASSDGTCADSHSSGSARSGSASSASQNPAPYKRSAQLGQNPSYPSPNSEYRSPQSRHLTTVEHRDFALCDSNESLCWASGVVRPKPFEGTVVARVETIRDGVGPFIFDSFDHANSQNFHGGTLLVGGVA